MKLSDLVIEKIKYQFPDNPEGRLMFAVIEQALKDLTAMKRSKEKPIPDLLIRASAENYLRGPMPHAELVGVSSDWIKRVINTIKPANPLL